ncbi:MAG: DEAD/DEAH box helicase, partial [Candidatus Aegiribacteria sp.]|nr:DEAD/DEAH box helicase [Candidatus Aegiribacteria sp.]MBD3294417.1 DEAD/DEAH box helicase [Candidatus Fermentibacteria bacterium]
MLTTDVRYLRGIGPARGKKLAKLNISTVGDLLLHCPREYNDRRVITPVSRLVPGQSANISGTVVSSGFLRSRNGRRRYQAVLRDDTGEILLTFFHYRYIASKLRDGTRILASGKVEYFGGCSMVHPELVFYKDGKPEGELVEPVYPLTEGLTQRVMRKLVKQALEECSDSLEPVLPADVLGSEGWNSRIEVFEDLHFPRDPETGESARRLLALEELYLHQLLLRRIRRSALLFQGISMNFSQSDVERFTAELPYELTGAQNRALTSILSDLKGKVPMRRLLQGDVGSGKTVVAAGACQACCEAGYQAVVLAPTSVLADQHFRSFSAFLEPFGIRCGLLTGGTPVSSRRELLQGVSSGSVGVLIGTHAVLEDTVSVPRMGLCVVDEQHKFGVQQRQSLLEGLQPAPHFLLMSATPIPRTLAMTMYGDLDMTVLNEMPPGRGRTVTRVMDRTRRAEVFEFLMKRISEGERAYIVYPLRESSSELDLKDAESSWRVLRDGPLGKYGVGLLTGTMKPQEKMDVAGSFSSGEISVLVSTTVVEVGLDVPEATVMIVAHADRFGLSQLHQLRGRIG